MHALTDGNYLCHCFFLQAPTVFIEASFLVRGEIPSCWGLLNAGSPGNRWCGTSWAGGARERVASAANLACCAVTIRWARARFRESAIEDSSVRYRASATATAARPCAATYLSILPSGRTRRLMPWAFPVILFQ